MTGAEVAWRTLSLEETEERCILGCWTMKRQFFEHYAGVQDIYADPVRTAVEAFANAGSNLNPQFIFTHPKVSLITGPKGEIVAKLQSSVEGVLVEDIDPSQVTEDMLKNRRPDLYDIVSEQK